MEALERLLALPMVRPTLGVAAAVVVSYLAFFAVRRVLLRLLDEVVRRSRVRWDDALHQHRVFERLSHVVPALVFYFGLALVPDLSEEALGFLRRVALAFILGVVALALGGLLSASNTIYAANPRNRQRPIQGYLQLVKIFLYVMAIVLVVATLMNRSPWLFLSGFGALSAVLILVFRDTLLSLVASVQLTNNDLLHIGDWIEMPQYGADGDVVEVALHSVQVQNFDKTITAIPTHKFLEQSFKNWRGMKRAGGRRIKRCLYLDMNSVHFLDEEEVARFEEWALLHDYVAAKREELARWNEQPGRDPRINADVRRLTNLGTFRAYAQAYLRNHPRIRQDLTLLVRQQQPGPGGIPIEIYCFTDTTVWSEYESIQSDVFDHLLAILDDFGLRVFQDPSGRDVAALARRRLAAEGA